MDVCSIAKVGLVDWLTHCDKYPGKKSKNSEAIKKLVGKKFSYSRSRVGTGNTFVCMEDSKANNPRSIYYSKGLNPNAPVFTPRASISNSVSSTNTSIISSRPPPVFPPIHHPKLTEPNLGLPHIYNVVTKNRFAALYNKDKLEEIGSTTSQFQKKKMSEDRCGIKVPVKNKKTGPALMAASKSSDMVVTVSDMSTQNRSMVNPEVASTEKKVHNDQVC